jgi:hypothetical protein
MGMAESEGVVARETIDEMRTGQRNLTNALGQIETHPTGPMEEEGNSLMCTAVESMSESANEIDIGTEVVIGIEIEIRGGIAEIETVIAKEIEIEIETETVIDARSERKTKVKVEKGSLGLWTGVIIKTANKIKGIKSEARENLIIAGRISAVYICML